MPADLTVLQPYDLVNSSRYEDTIVLVTTLKYQESIESFISSNKIIFKKIIYLSELFSLDQ